MIYSEEMMKNCTRLIRQTFWRLLKGELLSHNHSSFHTKINFIPTYRNSKSRIQPKLITTICWRTFKTMISCLMLLKLNRVAPSDLVWLTLSHSKHPPQSGKLTISSLTKRKCHKIQLNRSSRRWLKLIGDSRKNSRLNLSSTRKSRKKSLPTKTEMFQLTSSETSFCT